jgi:hypothetical protein
MAIPDPVKYAEAKRRLLKGLGKVVRDCEQLVADIAWWNANRTDAAPFDSGGDAQLGRQLADNLKLPTAIATQAIAVLGIRGSGKTNTAGVIAEELLAIGQPVVVVDPTDAWWGLRSSADGKKPGYPILIAGGSHGDLALAENDGKALAEFLVAEQVSAILSIRHLRKTGQRSFFVSLAEELYHLKGRPENRSALTLIIDEASSFVPQDVRGDVARSAGAVEDIVNRGRNVGFGVVMINQRAATLNKNVLTQCDTLVIHRMPSPQDRKAVALWVEENASDEQAAEVLGSIGKLQTGEAWLWSPAMDLCKRATIRLKETFDSSRTPKIGEAPRQPKKLAEVDLEQLKGKMATSIEVAKANDPKLLRARIADLESRLNKSASAVQTDPKIIEKAHAAGKAEGLREGAAALKERERIIKLLSGKLGRGEKAASDLAALLHVNGEATPAVNLPAQSIPNRIPPTRPRPAVAVPVASRSPARESSPGNSGGLSPRQQRFLDTAATLTTLGREVTREAIAAWNGIHPRTGSYGEDLTALANAGLIVNDRGRIAVTDEGMAMAQQLDPAEAIERAKSSLSNRQRKFFEMIVAVYPEQITREQIASQCDPPIHPRTGSFGEDLAALVGRGLVDGSRGVYRARDVLFASAGS